MSINLGTAAFAAAAALRGDPNWGVIRAAIAEQVGQKMNAALDSASGGRDDAIGYARALRDIHMQFESATTGAKIQQVVKPNPVGKPNA